jgi:hypothetical protein
MKPIGSQTRRCWRRPALVWRRPVRATSHSRTAPWSECWAAVQSPLSPDLDPAARAGPPRRQDTISNLTAARYSAVTGRTETASIISPACSASRSPRPFAIPRSFPTATSTGIRAAASRRAERTGCGLGCLCWSSVVMFETSPTLSHESGQASTAAKALAAPCPTPARRLGQARTYWVASRGGQPTLFGQEAPDVALCALRGLDAGQGFGASVGTSHHPASRSRCGYTDGRRSYSNRLLDRERRR